MLAPAAAPALALALLPALAPEPPTRVERTVPMMGTLLEITVEAPDREAALAASETAIRALEATEARLSTWRESSELARLNRAPVGEVVALSPLLAAELAAAADCWRQTEGAFDPGLGRVLAAWNLRQGGREPTAAELRGAAAGASLAALELTSGGAAVRRHPGLRIEEGGFGKGAGLDRAVAALAARPRPVRALLDLGGQVAVYGGGGPWTVAVADPRQRQRPVLALELAAGSVATSGNGGRGGAGGGQGGETRRIGHLFDPATGAPAEDFGSLTVVAPGGLSADCLATGLYVLGPERALAWAAAHPGVEVLVLETSPGGLRARASAGLAGRLAPLVAGLEVEWAAGPATRAGAEPETGIEGSPSLEPGHRRLREGSAAVRPRWRNEEGAVDRGERCQLTGPCSR